MKPISFKADQGSIKKTIVEEEMGELRYQA
jgi:hypothetical protein